MKKRKSACGNRAAANISKTRSKISISDNEFSLDDKKLFELWIFSKENYKTTKLRST